MSIKGIITVVGLAAVAGIAGLFALDEYIINNSNKSFKKHVNLPTAQMEDLTEKPTDDNEQEMQEMKAFRSLDNLDEKVEVGPSDEYQDASDGKEEDPLIFDIARDGEQGEQGEQDEQDSLIFDVDKDGDTKF